MYMNYNFYASFNFGRFGVPVNVTKKSIYSRDRNLWHLSHEGGVLEDPKNEPEEEMFVMTNNPEDAPSEPQYVTIGIESGIPVSSRMWP